MESETRRKNKELLVGTIIYGIGNIGTKFLSFLIVPLYTYFIQPGDLGDYDLLMTTVSLLSPLLTMKISDATYRWIIKSKSNDSTNECIAATYQLLIRNCMLCAAILLAVNWIVPIWNCYYFIAILIGDRVLECIQKLLRGVKNQRLFAISGMFYTAVMVGSNFIRVCWLKQGVTALLQSVLTAQVLTICLIFLLEKRIRVGGIRKNYTVLQREMLSYSVPLVPSALSWWVMSASDRYVIRFMMDKAANGIFSVSHKFPSILQTLFLMFNNAWTDMALAELNKDEQTQKYTKQIFQQLYKVSFGMVLVLIPLTKLVMQIILSTKYKEAAVYIGFLYLGTVFQGFTSFCSIGYMQGKKTGGAARTSACGAVVNLAVDLICIRWIGLFAASISTFLGYFVMWVMRIKDIKKEFPVAIDYRVFVPYLLVSVGMAMITIWTNHLADLLLAAAAGVFFLLDNRKMIGKVLRKVQGKVRGRKGGTAS